MPKRRHPEEMISKRQLRRIVKERTDKDIEDVERKARQSENEDRMDNDIYDTDVPACVISNETTMLAETSESLRKFDLEHPVITVAEVTAKPSTINDDLGDQYRYSDSEADDEIIDFSGSGEICDNLTSSFDSAKSDEALFHEVEQNLAKQRENQFKLSILLWALQFKVLHNCLRALLAILIAFTGIDFPKDPRTFLRTPKTSDIQTIGKGQYCHIGLRKAVEKIINKREQMKHNFNEVRLLINIDGAPVGNSTEKGLWPILCKDRDLSNVYIIGIYYGRGKPEDVNEYLKAFVDEAVTLVDNDFLMNGKKYNVIIHALVCDAPAKAFVLNIKYHSGYNSCTKCTIDGDYIGRGICFPTSRSWPLRQNDKFRNMEYTDFQRGYTILNRIPKLGLVTNIVLDSMHLVYLGVVKKIITLCMATGPHNVRFSSSQIEQMSIKLENLMKNLPNGFARRSRPLKYWKCWKATEFRHFLLYIGPVVLKDVLGPREYKHFITLHVAISILNDPALILDENNLNVAQKLLDNFVKKFAVIYGPENVTYNVHNLIHVTDQVRFYNVTLDSLSSFPFESYICSIKKMLRKGEAPLQQISRRLAELEVVEFNDLNTTRADLNLLITTHKKESTNMRFEQRQCMGVVANLREYDAQYSLLRMPNCTINCNDNKNDCVILKDATYVNIYSFAIANNVSYIIGRELAVQENLYEQPLSSNKLDIKVVKDKNYPLQEWPCDLICRKIFKVPYGRRFIAFPILHTCNTTES